MKAMEQEEDFIRKCKREKNSHALFNRNNDIGLILRYPGWRSCLFLFFLSKTKVVPLHLLVPHDAMLLPTAQTSVGRTNVYFGLTGFWFQLSNVYHINGGMVYV